MTDPLSVAAGVVGVATAAFQTAKSLYDVANRFKDRDKTLRRLRQELEELLGILENLQEVADIESSTLKLLCRPMERCDQECREFERELEAFGKSSKVGARDWAKMEFKRGNINDFIDRIASCKATISLALGTVTMRASQVTEKVVKEYNDLIQDTVYELHIRLNRIDEKLQGLDIDKNANSYASINLRDERDVTKQCLKVCEEAKTFIESLTARETPLLQETNRSANDDEDVKVFYEAQRFTRQVLEENLDRFSKTIDHLQKTLDSRTLGEGSVEEQRARFQEDISISKQCLEVCRIASEVSNKKIYRVGEAIARDNSDQVVVSTLADLFDVKKALAQGNSAQLVASLTPENFRDVTKERYKSRSGKPINGSGTINAGNGSSTAAETQENGHFVSLQWDTVDESSVPEDRPKPFSNETRKRNM